MNEMVNINAKEAKVNKKCNGKVKAGNGTKAKAAEERQKFFDQHGKQIEAAYQETKSWMGVMRKTKLNDALIGYVLERLHKGFTKDRRVVRMITDDKVKKHA